MIALTILIIAEAMTAVYALRSSAAAAKSLSEDRLKRMQHAQDLVQATWLIDRMTENILEAKDRETLSTEYGKAIDTLDACDQTMEAMSSGSSDIAILTIHQTEQRFRNSTHIMVKLRNELLLSETALTNLLHDRISTLMTIDEPTALPLTLLFYRLQNSHDRPEIEILRNEFVAHAEATRQLPTSLRQDLAMITSAQNRTKADPFSLQIRVLNLQNDVQRFHQELHAQSLDMTTSARELSVHFTNDYRDAIRQLAKESTRQQHWIIAIQLGGIVIAFVIARFFVGRHIMDRMQQISHHLRIPEDTLRTPRIPVQGDDEIGEMARAIEKLLENRRRLAEAHQEMKNVSYSIAHDLRSPLRAIDGFSHLLGNKYHDQIDSEGKRHLDIISKNAQRMGKLIDDLLNFAHISRATPSFATVDMNLLVREVWAEMMVTLGNRQVVFQPADLPPASCDQTLIHRVLAHLLSNAIKFTASRTDATISVSAIRKDNETIYQVADNGVGFDMQYTSRMFGIFQRLHDVEEFEGTGMGLAIVKRIIELHEGRVWAEGKLGAGATISFSLPDRPLDTRK
jgi:signal transduction histidine kinase